MGILDMAAIARIEETTSGRSAFLAPPYSAVGPFSLDELEARGRTRFGECLIMSRLRWQEDQVDLRLKARRKRQALLSRLESGNGEEEYREALDLPPEGTLLPADINTAFRRMAKAAHPDAGGSNEQYRHIVEARDALLQRWHALP
jgi:hypothetical protein